MLATKAPILVWTLLLCQSLANPLKVDGKSLELALMKPGIRDKFRSKSSIGLEDLNDLSISTLYQLPEEFFHLISDDALKKLMIQNGEFEGLTNRLVRCYEHCGYESNSTDPDASLICKKMQAKCETRRCLNFECPITGTQVDWRANLEGIDPGLIRRIRPNKGQDCRLASIIGPQYDTNCTFHPNFDPFDDLTCSWLQHLWPKYPTGESIPVQHWSYQHLLELGRLVGCLSNYDLMNLPAMKLVIQRGELSLLFPTTGHLSTGQLTTMTGKILGQNETVPRQFYPGLSVVQLSRMAENDVEFMYNAQEVWNQFSRIQKYAILLQSCPLHRV